MKFVLGEPLQVARKGEQELIYNITLNAPTAKVRTHIIRLKKLFLKAITSVNTGQKESGAEAGEKENNDELKGAQIIALMYLSDVNVLEFHDLMKELVLSPGVAMLDDVKMTNHLYDQMDLDDTESLIGEYFASFLAPSLMRNLGN